MKKVYPVLTDRAMGTRFLDISFFVLKNRRLLSKLDKLEDYQTTVHLKLNRMQTAIRCNLLVFSLVT